MGRSVMKKPSAIAPIVMSLLALLLIVVHVARYGLVQDTDEGTSAHLFQLLMVCQVPIVVFFALRWLPESPAQARIVLALQLSAGLVAFAALVVFEYLASSPLPHP